MSLANADLLQSLAKQSISHSEDPSRTCETLFLLRGDRRLTADLPWRRMAEHQASAGQPSGTPDPAAQDETANESRDSAADGVQGDHADQQEPEDHQGCAALPVAVSACDHNLGNTDQKGNGEDRAAGLREPKPLTEPSPIGSESSHAREC